MYSISKSISCLILLIICSCDVLNNKRDEKILDCGSDLGLNAKYFFVEDTSGRRLENGEFEALSVAPSGVEKLTITSRGCVVAESKDHLLFRGVDEDEAVLVSSSASASGGRVQLAKVGDEAIDIACDPKIVTNINSDFKFEDLFLSNIPQHMQDAFLLNAEYVGLKNPRIYASLKTVGAQRSLTSEIDEGVYFSLKISVSNQLRKNSEITKTCKFRKDSTAPTVTFTINSRSNYEKINWKSVQDIAVVKSGESINFVSDTTDLKTIEYCAAKLNDDFDGSDNDGSSAWYRGSVDTTCNHYDKIDLGKRFVPGDGQGFWSINYRAIDTTGNISATRKINILFKNSATVDLIKSFAKISITSNLSDKRPDLAIKEALRLESQRMQLVTRYERDYTQNFTLSAILNVLNQPILPIDFKYKRKDIKSVTVGNTTGNAYSRSRNKILLWDSETRKLKSELDTGSFDIESLLISPKEDIAIIQKRGGMEVWDLHNRVLLRTLFREREQPSALVAFTDDGKYLVVVLRDSIQTYDSSTLDLIYNSSIKKNKETISFVELIPGTTEAFVRDQGFGIERIDFITGKVIEVVPRHSKEAVTSLVWNDKAGILYIASNRSPIEAWNSISKTTAVLDLKQTGWSRLFLDKRTGYIASTDDTGYVVIWNSTDHVVLNTFFDQQGSNAEVAWNADSSGLFTVNSENIIRYWTVKNSLQTLDLKVSESSGNVLHWLDENNLIVDLSDPSRNQYNHIDAEAKRYDLLNADRLFKSDENDDVYLAPTSHLWCVKVAFTLAVGDDDCKSIDQIYSGLSEISSDLKTAAVRNTISEGSTFRDELSLIDIETKKIKMVISVPWHEAGREVAFSHNSEIIFVSSGKTLSAYETATGRLRWTKVMEDYVSNITVKDDGTEVVVELYNYTLMFVDLKKNELTGALRWSSPLYGANIDRLHISSSAGLIAFGIAGAELSLWDYESKEQLLTFLAPNAKLTGGMSAMNLQGNRIAWMTRFDDVNDAVRVLIWDIDRKRSLSKLCSFVSDSSEYFACR